MKTWLLLLLLGVVPGWLWRVRERNDALAQAQAAYRRGDALQAAAGFARAVRLARRPGPALLLDLGHAQARAGRAADARATYGQLLGPDVPPALGSTARQQLAVLLAAAGKPAQALGLLQQALVLNPANQTARYNYEVLRQRLQQPDAPPADGAPPPASLPPGPRPAAPKPAPGPGQRAPQPTERAGTQRPGQAPDPAAAPPPAGDGPPPRPEPQAAPNSRPDPGRPSPAAGANASGSFGPGAGAPQPLPSGFGGGPQRGLDAGAPLSEARRPPANSPGRAGAEAATDADLNLQTQRERLRQLNLTPAQAQQLLEALRQREAQYLQQQAPSRPARPLDPKLPTW